MGNSCCQILSRGGDDSDQDSREPEGLEAGASVAGAVPPFNMYASITIGDPPWATLTIRQPATWPPPLGGEGYHWWRRALPVTL